MPFCINEYWFKGYSGWGNLIKKQIGTIMKQHCFRVGMNGLNDIDWLNLILHLVYFTRMSAQSKLQDVGLHVFELVVEDHPTRDVNLTYDDGSSSETKAFNIHSGIHSTPFSQIYLQFTLQSKTLIFQTLPQVLSSWFILLYVFKKQLKANP